MEKKTDVLLFRLGTTSYIYPDHIIPNVHKLKDRVNDIELVLFEVKDKSNIPSRQQLKELINIAEESALSYTVHLPLDINLGHPTQNKRLDSITKVTALIDYLSALKPHTYILHLNLSDCVKENINPEHSRRVDLWQDRVNNSLSRILGDTGIDADKIAVENLDYPFSYVEPAIIHNNLSVCIDIGHLINAGADVKEHLTRYLGRTRVIHFHGVNNNKDHTSLQYLDKKLIGSVYQLLKKNNYRGVLTLEVFSESDFEESMTVLNRLVRSSQS